MVVLAVGRAMAVPPVLRARWRDEGLILHEAATAADALRLVEAAPPAVVALDLALGDRDALELLEEMVRRHPGIPVLALAPAGGAERALAAMRAGAIDALVLPLAAEALADALRAAAAAPSNPLRTRRAPLPGRDADAGTDTATMIGSSPQMAAVHRAIAAVARSKATVFITGESGTGKELAALAIHARSPRAGGPFVALNCGAIPFELMESEIFGHVKGSFTGAIADKPGAAVAADGGTLFLDEICEMAPALQTKLLRFLQTSTVQPVGATRPRRVDLRIVCATNRDPLEAVRRGEFREDLFYRLHVVPLHLPPLRERGQDVIEIAEAALRRYAAEEGKSFAGLTPGAAAMLASGHWPGNVRELLNVMRHVTVLHEGGPVSPEMLPPFLPVGNSPSAPSAPAAPAPTMAGDPCAGLTLAEIERRAITAALERHGGAVARAANELGLAPSTLYRKLGAWGMTRR